MKRIREKIQVGVYLKREKNITKYALQQNIRAGERKKARHV